MRALHRLDNSNSYPPLRRVLSSSSIAEHVVDLTLAHAKSLTHTHAHSKTVQNTGLNERQLRGRCAHGCLFARALDTFFGVAAEQKEESRKTSSDLTQMANLLNNFSNVPGVPNFIMQYFGAFVNAGLAATGHAEGVRLKGMDGAVEEALGPMKVVPPVAWTRSGLLTWQQLRNFVETAVTTVCSYYAREINEGLNEDSRAMRFIQARARSPASSSLRAPSFLPLAGCNACPLESGTTLKSALCFTLATHGRTD